MTYLTTLLITVPFDMESSPSPKFSHSAVIVIVSSQGLPSIFWATTPSLAAALTEIHLPFPCIDQT